MKPSTDNMNMECLKKSEEKPFDKPENPTHNHNNIILLLMIKNEEKIIERCLTKALPFVDAVAILDTGSTDNTIKECEKFLSASGKPYKINTEPFKNFGYNRTFSFQKAVELCDILNWDKEKTYCIAVDADMNVVVSPEFKKFNLTATGYKAIQANSRIKYYNVRFMRCSFDWKCIGSTHEYWSGEQTDSIPYEVFYIDDKGDGGCKADKFERDVRLLTEELKESPNNPRTHFYLAQSLKDSGKFKESISYYKKRIEIGGWVEEVWYSYYQIAKCYEVLKDIDKMELWANKAFNFYPKRAEPLYYLTRYFRENSHHYKAYHYYMKGKDIPYPKNDLLFIENNVYEGLFDYENTILACYVKNKARHESVVDLITYINRNIPYYINNTRENIHYYVETLESDTYKGTYSGMNFPQIEEYKPSSISLIPYTEDKFLINIRYINYSIDEKGSYHMRSSDNHVKTQNGMVYLDSNFKPLNDIVMMDESLVETYPSNIEGLEDIRLFNFRNNIYFSSSSKNVTPTGKIVIAVGQYDVYEQSINNVFVIEPPKESNCEKNWVAVSEKFLTHTHESRNKMNFIYDWHPLQIGAVNDANQLVIHTKYDTPTFFSRFRGSSNIFEFNNTLWSVVHYVRYSMPRVYYHCIVQFEKNTMKPQQYSYPFCFRNRAIEYCLGFVVKEKEFSFFISENDSNPGIITVLKNNLKFLTV